MNYFRALMNKAELEQEQQCAVQAKRITKKVRKLAAQSKRKLTAQEKANLKKKKLLEQLGNRNRFTKKAGWKDNVRAIATAPPPAATAPSATASR